MLPTPKSAHRDAALSNISIMHKNQDYICDRVFPTVPVKKQSDYFYTFRKGAWFRNEAGVRGPGGVAPSGGYPITDTRYNCIEYAHAHQIPIELLNNADDALRPLTTGVGYVTDKVILAKEVLTSTACCTAANWTSSYDAEGGWVATTDGSGNTFIADVLTAIDTVRKLIGRKPNIMVMDFGTFKNVKQEFTVLERIKYTGTQGAPADVTSNTLAQLFELDEVLIGTSIYSDAEEVVAGTDFNAVDLWETNAGKGSCFLYYRPPSPALEVPSAGYCFNWGERAKGSGGEKPQGGLIRSVRRWWEDKTKSWWIEGSECFDVKVTSADAGYLFYDTIST